ncbi:MAG: hypothetical protein JJ936_15205, partial [Psychroserpens sp.]|nr:hypothetical protein [Psychroserpens sp.]
HNISNALIFALVGLPLYFLFYVYQKKKIKEDLKVSAVKKVATTPSAVKDLEAYKRLLKDYKTYNKFAYIFFSAALLFVVLYFVFNTDDLAAAKSASIELSGISAFIFLIYALVTGYKFGQLQEQVKQRKGSSNALWTLLSLIAYPIVNSLRHNKIKRDLST